MVVPAGARSFAEAIRIGAEVYHALRGVLHERGLATAVGDEGGFAPDLPSSEAAIEAILEAAERAGHREAVAIALDPATSEVYRDGAYRFEGRELGSAELAGFWADLVDRYPIVSIEDGAAEDDWEAWRSDHARARRPRPARRRRPLRHEPGAPAARDRRGGRELDPRQGEPDRHADRDARGDHDRPGRRLHRGHLAPLGRDRGHDDRRPRGRDERRPDQDRRAGALRPGRQVQPAAPDRRGARRRCPSTPAGRPSRASAAEVVRREARLGRGGGDVQADEDRRDDRPRLGLARDAARARRGRHGRRPAQLLARHARGARRRAPRSRGRCRPSSAARWR